MSMFPQPVENHQNHLTIIACICLFVLITNSTSKGDLKCGTKIIILVFTSKIRSKYMKIVQSRLRPDPI